MDTNTQLSNICPIHKVPLKNGVCPICEREGREPVSPAEPVYVEQEVSAMKKCPKCGFSAPADAKYCPRCGYDFSGEPGTVVEEEPREEEQAYAKVVVAQDVKLLDVIRFVPEERTKKPIEVRLQNLGKPYAKFGQYKGIEVLADPENRLLLMQNRANQKWFLNIKNPVPVYNNQEIRLGKIGFVLKYANMVSEDVDYSHTVMGNISHEDEELLFDILICTHPNFKDKRMNLETEKIEMNRQFLSQILGVSDENRLKVAGVSSKSVFFKKVGNLWTIEPGENPYVFVKIPQFFYFIPMDGSKLEINGSLYNIKLGAQ